MKIKIGKLFYAFLIAAAVLTISCEKDDAANKIDMELYDMAIETLGFTWYKKSDALLNRSIGSAHSQPLLRTRYNEIATASLDENGMIMGNAIFAEGSVIVKELYGDATTLSQYAILYKKNNSEFADKDGWVWGYLSAKGSVIESVSKKGSSCISCHKQEGSIDHMLMNKFFP